MDRRRWFLISSTNFAIKNECEQKRSRIYQKGKGAIDAATSAAERETVLRSLYVESDAIIGPGVQQALKVVKLHAADAAAVEPLVWIVKSRRDADVGQAAVDLLMKYHLTHRQTLDLAYWSKLSGNRWVEPLLRRQVAAADLPDDQRPKQTLALAACLQRLAEIKTGEAQKLEQEAIKLYAVLGKTYPNKQLLPGLTFGDLAKSAVFEIKNLSLGKMAPDIEGKDLDGVKFKLSDYRGKVVMLSFWGSWCGPCMELVPHERELIERYRGKPFVIVGVNADPDKDNLKPVLEQNQITWRSFWCGEKGPIGPIPQTWNIGFWPSVYLIDHAGVIRLKRSYNTALDAMIEKLVAEAEKLGQAN